MPQAARPTFSHLRRAVIRRIRGMWAEPWHISTAHRVLEGEVSPALRDGWQEPCLAVRQHAAFEPLLTQMHAGEPRADFVVLAEAVRATETADPLIVEVGCGTGVNAEVLRCLLGHDVRYVGVDYSSAMTSAGRRRYSHISFAIGDAAALPLATGACDILLSGSVLMHLASYDRAIRESRRVTRRWCVFHMVPVLQRRATTLLSKLAYGRPVVEVVFNETDLQSLFRAAGLSICRAFDTVPYDLEAVLGEPTRMRTYLCEAQGE